MSCKDNTLFNNKQIKINIIKRNVKYINYITLLIKEHRD